MQGRYPHIKPVATGETCWAYGMRDTKDCTVRALANAADIPYDEAHAAMRKGGRKDHHGSCVTIVNKVYSDYGFEWIGIFGKTNGALWLARNCPNVKHYAGLSLSKALKAFNSGTYCFVTKAGGHILAVQDGSVVDTQPSLPGESVIAIFKLKD